MHCRDQDKPLLLVWLLQALHCVSGGHGQQGPGSNPNLPRALLHLQGQEPWTPVPSSQLNFVLPTGRDVAGARMERELVFVQLGHLLPTL